MIWVLISVRAKLGVVEPTKVNLDSVNTNILTYKLTQQRKLTRNLVVEIKGQGISESVKV